MFGNTADRATPDNDRFQAIVPAYTFQCSGRVTEWRACVQPGGNSSEQYYIQFQVWRSTGIDGCYDLVGYNTPLDVEESEVSYSVIIIDDEGFLLPGRDSAPNGCVILPVRESQQIEFQSGDVIGYYVDYFRDGVDRDEGGIQWFRDEGGTQRFEDDEDRGGSGEDNGVVVHYKFNLPREDVKSQYAIYIHPSACGFPTESSNLYSLSDVASSTPIIGLSIGK